MAEYVDKQKARDLFQQKCYNVSDRINSVELGMFVDGIMQVLDEATAADVQPVIHAHWIELPKALNPNENPCQCSNCKHILSFMNHYPKSKYCDECGARMDGGAENG